MTSLLNDNKIFHVTKKIYFLLGPQCNMMCRHCSQTPIKLGEKIQHNVSQKVWNFFDNYVAYAIKQKDKCRTIVFWGGEPLLHWDFIKETVIRYTEKFNLLEVPKNRFMFTLVTNGLLLTEDKLEFMKKYGVKPSFSYDAPDPFAVRGKVSDKICDLLKNSGVNYSTISTFNGINCDYYLACRCMRKKFPKVRHCFNFALLHLFEDMPKDILTYDWDTIKKNVKKLRIAAATGDLDAAMMIVHLMWPLRYPNDCKTFRTHYVKACFSGGSNFSITMDGKIVTCHNSEDVVGTLDDSAEDIWNRSLASYKAKGSPECKDCEHNDLCIGNCPFSVRDEEGRYVSCQQYRIPFFTIFKEEMKKLNTPVTEEEKKWFKEECRKDDAIVEAF